MTLQSISWKDFAKEYLPKVGEKQPIPAKKLTKALVLYLEKCAKIKLSQDGHTTLKTYAFHKAGHKYDEKIALTYNQASKIFFHFHQTLDKLHVELTTEFKIVKPDQPTIPKEYARRAMFSPTIVEKYLEPAKKKNIEICLEQIEKINQKVTHFQNPDPNLDPKKIFALELISKHLAYYNPKNHEIIKIPFEGRLIEYVVEEIPLWMGMHAYGFKPANTQEKAPPILVFSGTRLGFAARSSLATITADLDPRGVGYIAYSNGKTKISNWLSKVNGNAIVTGHSLGGALARYAAIDNPNHVYGAFTFSSPGISSTYAKKWKLLKKDKTLKCPVLYNFSHIKDTVPTLGHSYVGKNYQVICVVEKTAGKTFSAKRKIHYKKLFGRPIALFCKIHPKKSLSVAMQRILSVIPFLFCLAMLYLSRLFCGIYKSTPFVEKLEVPKALENNNETPTK